MDIKDIYKEKEIGKTYKVSGWVRNHRKQAKFGFIDLNDGTCFDSLQVVYDDKLDCFNEIQKLKLGSAINSKDFHITAPHRQAATALQSERFASARRQT